MSHSRAALASSVSLLNHNCGYFVWICFFGRNFQGCWVLRGAMCVWKGSAPLLDAVREELVGDLGGGGPPPLLGQPRPPRLLPLTLLLVVELDAVQGLPTVPTPNHWNIKKMKSQYSMVVISVYIFLHCHPHHSYRHHPHNGSNCNDHNHHYLWEGYRHSKKAS